MGRDFVWIHVQVNMDIVEFKVAVIDNQIDETVISLLLMGTRHPTRSVIEGHVGVEKRQSLIAYNQFWKRSRPRAGGICEPLSKQSHTKN
jgi:hypothetical protein